jgi:tripartite-type tricarboxylate transporter receptor subunit TctC
LNFVLIFTLGCVAAEADEQYPGRPVRIVVPFSAGGPTDIVGRIIGAKLGELLGQQFFVENKVGAGGNIGADLVAKSPPDGYTLLVATVSTHAINPGLYGKMPYDPVRDFSPVAQVGVTPTLLGVHPSVPATDIKSLVALVRQNPGKYTYGSSGLGSILHLCGEQFKALAGGLDIQHVPYRGGGQLITDLVGGQIPLGLIGLPPTLPHIRAGRLKALAVTARKRSPSLPDVPTVEEAGLAGYETVQWFGPVAPAGTPKPVIDRLFAEFTKALKNPVVIERLAGAGLEVAPSASPEAYGQFIRAEYARWPAIVKAAGDGAKIQ